MRNCPTCKTPYPAGTVVCPKDGTPLSETDIWAENSIVRGKYRVLERVGVGGMATVYRAEHVHFLEICALKVINASLIHDEALVERFMREAVLTRRLHHPNAVRVEDIDRAEDGCPFMVMEFLEGQTLHEVLHLEGPLPYERVRTIAAQVASALHAAHEIGIIHRDIKPSNITILKTPQGDAAKVLDFGIAKLKEAKIEHAFEDDFTLTTAGMIVGTPAYVSPEQALGKRGSELDGRSDVYSFAVLVFQMLTGKLPVHADTEEQYVMAHATAEPIDITHYLPDLPPPVAALIMACLSKNPEDRPDDPRVLTQEMDKWDNVEEAAPEPQAPLPRAPLPRWVLLTTSGLLAIVLCTFLWFLTQRGHKTEEENQASLIQPSSLSLPTGDMILIPSGAAMLGEHNHMQNVAAFYIDKTEVSTRVYLEFCAITHYKPPTEVSAADGDLPIRNVSLADATEFAKWAHKRLPTAVEWEKAARGTQGQHFPWGNELGTGMARLPTTSDEAVAAAQPQAVASPVESFPQGASSYGAVNMVGNVWEWVKTPKGEIRGGSYQSYPPQNNQSFESLVYAGEAVPTDTRRSDIGFRCAR